MKTDALYEQLKRINATRQKRLETAEMVLENPDLFEPLLQLLYQVDDKVSAKAAWVFEFVCFKDLSFLLPHLDYFSERLSTLKLDSAIRPVAKVCQLLVERCYSKMTQPLTLTLTEAQKSNIVEACFNWLITDQKVAAKVYAMNSLLHLGKEFDWIHQELILILEKDYAHQSAGFQAKARHILSALRKT